MAALHSHTKSYVALTSSPPPFLQTHINVSLLLIGGTVSLFVGHDEDISALSNSAVVLIDKTAH